MTMYRKLKPSLTKARKLTPESYLIADEVGFREAYFDFLSGFGVGDISSLQLPVLKKYLAVVVFKIDTFTTVAANPVITPKPSFPSWLHQGDIDFVLIPEATILAARFRTESLSPEAAMRHKISRHSIAGCSLAAISSQTGGFIKEVSEDKRS